MATGFGTAGTSAVLFDGSNLEGTVFSQKGGFKAARTGVRETHEILWTNPTPWIYTISNITKPEIVTQQRIDNFVPNALQGSISKITQSNKAPLFIPTVPIISKQKDNEIATNTNAFKEALGLSEIDYGVVTELPIEYVNSEAEPVGYTHVSPGWACYPKQKANTPLSLSTNEKLDSLFNRGNVDKSKRISADRARILIVDELIGSDWYEQSILTEARIKAFFSMIKAKQLKLISAQRDGVPNGDVQINVARNAEMIERNDEIHALRAELDQLEEDEELNEVRWLEDKDMEEMIQNMEEQPELNTTDGTEGD